MPDLPRSPDGLILPGSIPVDVLGRIRRAFEKAAQKREFVEAIGALRAARDWMNSSGDDQAINEYLRLRGVVAMHLSGAAEKRLRRRDADYVGEFTTFDALIPGVDEPSGPCIPPRIPERRAHGPEPDNLNGWPIQQVLSLQDDYWLMNEVNCRLAREDGTFDATGLSGPERTIALVFLSSGIIGNGGFQYLFEGYIVSDLDFALTLSAYHQIGASRAAEAFESAMALFRFGRPPQTIRKRLQIFHRASGLKRALIDSAFFAAEAEIERCSANFIRSHQRDFLRLP